MPFFERYVGIDYSGAGTAQSSLSGLRVYAADRLTKPREIMPDPSPRKYWTRRGVADWLCKELSGGKSSIVGIDHGFSFPLVYFEKHRLRLNWDTFLDNFQRHCPTDKGHTCVDFIREGDVGSWTDVMGDSSWLRLAERWTATAKSVFRFDVQGSVAKATYAGLPWLRHLRNRCGGQIHFWPFDGWAIPPQGRSVIAEVYPSLWMKRFPFEGRNSDQHAAYSVAAWLQRNDLSDSLLRFFDPPLQPQERTTAQIEGWILGVV